ncbi:MAG: hypothetical protein M1331_02625 [Candidatus Marsarchaeota archaeon]|nr:hypothetical protein [Candidatus Marsarchaeota archaeon]
MSRAVEPNETAAQENKNAQTAEAPDAGRDPKKEETANAQENAAKQQAPKNPKEEELEKLREVINGLRQQRNDLIKQIKENKYRLYYKESEKVGITKLLNETQDTTDFKKISYLKRLKNRLEFKISTSPLSLKEEKDIVRKVNEVNEELSKSMKFVRMKRKLELVEKDIVQYQASVSDLNEKISAIDLKLDDYFSKLRALSRSGRKPGEYQHRERQYRERGHGEDNRKYEVKETPNFSIEDIVVIKKPKASKQ